VGEAVKATQGLVKQILDASWPAAKD
jgi:hypothetical protein